MRSRIVPVKNIARLSAASKALTNRAPNAPGMGLVEGETGYGKSTAIAWLANQSPSIYVRAMAVWTPSAMLGAMARELRLPVGGSCAAQVERIIEALAEGRQTVFVDEADYIVNSTRMTETLRDLHDVATVPVVLIGMAGISQRLSQRKQLTGRLAQHVTFEQMDIDDTALLARELAEVTVQPDLIEHLHGQARGSVRLIVVALARIEQMARSRGLGAIGLADLGKKAALFTGEAPAGVPMPVAA